MPGKKRDRNRIATKSIATLEWQHHKTNIHVHSHKHSPPVGGTLPTPDLPASLPACLPRLPHLFHLIRPPPTAQRPQELLHTADCLVAVHQACLNLIKRSMSLLATLSHSHSQWQITQRKINYLIRSS